MLENKKLPSSAFQRNQYLIIIPELELGSGR